MDIKNKDYLSYIRTPPAGLVAVGAFDIDTTFCKRLFSVLPRTNTHLFRGEYESYLISFKQLLTHVQSILKNILPDDTYLEAGSQEDLFLVILKVLSVQHPRIGAPIFNQYQTMQGLSYLKIQAELRDTLYYQLNDIFKKPKRINQGVTKIKR